MFDISTVFVKYTGFDTVPPVHTALIPVNPLPSPENEPVMLPPIILFEYKISIEAEADVSTGI